MKRLILFALIFPALSSCKKDETFIHTEEYYLPDCACCEYANLIEGSYTGTYLSRLMYVPVGSPYVIMDTFVYATTTLNVTKINVDQDFVTDSMVCALYIDGYVNDTIYIHDGSGNFTPQLYTTQKFNLASGQLNFHATKTFSAPIPSTYTAISFNGLK